MNDRPKPTMPSFPFTASNGITLYTTDGAPAGNGRGVFLPTYALEAAREYAEALRDAEWERWRYRDDPEWFVRVFGGPHQIEVVHEPTNTTRHYFAPTSVGRETEKVWNGIPGPDFDVIARAWYARHSRLPRPWEKALPGEAWRLTIEYRGTQTALVEEQGLFRTQDGHGWTLDHGQILHGERIYSPKEDSA